MKTKLKKNCYCGDKGTTHTKIELYTCNEHSIYDFYKKELEEYEKRTRRCVKDEARI